MSDKKFSDFDAAMIVKGCWDLVDVEPSEENFIAAAQQLINTGTAWSLQGHFGRTCSALIEAGYCYRPEAK